MRTPPVVVRLALALLGTALALLAAPSSRAGDAPVEAFDAAAPAVRKLLDSDKGADRLQGLTRAGRLRDPRALDLVLDAVAKEAARSAALSKAQAETAASLETALSDVERANAENPRSAREVEAFNKRVKKIEAKRDAAYARLRELAADALQARAIAAAVPVAAAGIVDGVAPAAAPALLERLAAAWNGPKAGVDDRLRWVDVLAAVGSVPTAPALRALARDASLDVRVRAAAVAASATRGGDAAVEDCVAALAERGDAWPVAAAGVDGLRRLHRREGIEPLIEMLGREDLGRLREDAHRALRSLTGQGHGPYRQPWVDWWKEAKATFPMPEKPADALDLTRPEKGVTFYGITSFSDRILFVLDVSGSMTDAAYDQATGARADERRIDLLRKELAATLAMLDPRRTFEVVLFSHRVVRLMGAMTPATPPAVEKAKKLVVDTEPAGGTNLHDALETAFLIAGVGTATTTRSGPPVVDTIFFMTDGKPTAGKLQKPDEILEAVRSWNRSANLTIHTIAMGDDCDVAFLEALAVQNHGRFVKR